ncbi:MAG: 50S ribosomal protein L18e [Halobacteria archaeon]
MAAPRQGQKLRALIPLLQAKGRESGRPLWRDLVERLDAPRAGRAALNVGQISRKTKANELAVVPGKVLSAGRLDHPVTVAALGFSDRAREKVAAAGGRCLTLEEFAGMGEVKGVRILRG